MSALLIAYVVWPKEKTEAKEVAFELPEARLNFKAQPGAMKIIVNGKELLSESGEYAKTPYYSYKSRIGDKVTVTFENTGFAPVTVERDVVFPQQDIEVTMLTTEEAALAQLTSVPKIVIDSDPEGAKIKVNGESKGKAPVTLENVDFGRELRIEASLDDHLNATETYIASRDSKRELKLTLEEGTQKTARQAASEHKSKTVAKKDVSKKSPSAAKVASGVGKISVKAKPWGVVSIDGSRVGNTPKTQEVKSGTHKVEIHLPNKNLRVNKSVVVKPNQTVNVGYDFNAGKWM